METIAIGCTRAGLALKKEIITYLEKKGFKVDDLGMKEGGDFVPYNKAAAAVAAGISKGKYQRGIIICGTGAGSVITAAKFKGVYPVHAFDCYTADRAKAVNNCNALVLGEWITHPNVAYGIIDAWMNAKFGDGSTPEWTEFLRGCIKEIDSL